MTNIGNIPGVNPALTNLGQEPAATPPQALQPTSRLMGLTSAVRASSVFW